MTDHDESLLDKVKNALGMGDEEHQERGGPRDEQRREEYGTESGVPADAPTGESNDTWGVDGAAQATGREGVSGGTGSTAALGGAGAGGPAGATPEPSLDRGKADADRVDTGTVKTEYEMGHEFDPAHETRAESGTLRESTSGAGQYGAEPGGGTAREGGTAAGTRGEAASGESPFSTGEDDEDSRPT